MTSTPKAYDAAVDSATENQSICKFGMNTTDWRAMTSAQRFEETCRLFPETYFHDELMLQSKAAPNKLRKFVLDIDEINMDNTMFDCVEREIKDALYEVVKQWFNGNPTNRIAYAESTNKNKPGYHITFQDLWLLPNQIGPLTDDLIAELRKRKCDWIDKPVNEAGVVKSTLDGSLRGRQKTLRAVLNYKDPKREDEGFYTKPGHNLRMIREGMANRDQDLKNWYMDMDPCYLGLTDYPPLDAKAYPLVPRIHIPFTGAMTNFERQYVANMIDLIPQDHALMSDYHKRIKAEIALKIIDDFDLYVKFMSKKNSNLNNGKPLMSKITDDWVDGLSSVDEDGMNPVGGVVNFVRLINEAKQKKIEAKYLSTKNKNNVVYVNDVISKTDFSSAVFDLRDNFTFIEFQRKYNDSSKFKMQEFLLDLRRVVCWNSKEQAWYHKSMTKSEMEVSRYMTPDEAAKAGMEITTNVKGQQLEQDYCFMEFTNEIVSKIGGISIFKPKKDTKRYDFSDGTSFSFAKNLSDMTFNYHVEGFLYCTAHTFKPIEGFINLYVEPQWTCEKEFTRDEEDHVRRFINEVICNGEEAQIKWIWAFMHKVIVQRQQVGQMLMFVSHPGSGKSTFGQIIGRCLTDAYSRVGEDWGMFSTVFNKDIGKMLFVMFDEIPEISEADKGNVNKLKTYITSKRTMEMGKGHDREMSKNCTNWAGASNSKAASVFDSVNGDRRVTCIRPSKKLVLGSDEHKTFFRKLYDIMNQLNFGYAFIQVLKAIRDPGILFYNFSVPLETTLKDEMKLASNPLATFMDMIGTRKKGDKYCIDKDVDGKPNLFSHYKDWCNRLSHKHLSLSAFQDSVNEMATYYSGSKKKGYTVVGNEGTLHDVWSRKRSNGAMIYEYVRDDAKKATAEDAGDDDEDDE